MNMHNQCASVKRYSVALQILLTHYRKQVAAQPWGTEWSGRRPHAHAKESDIFFLIFPCIACSVFQPALSLLRVFPLSCWLSILVFCSLSLGSAGPSRYVKPERPRAPRMPLPTVPVLDRNPFSTRKEDLPMATYVSNQLYQVPLAELQPDPAQPRKYMDLAALEEMTASVGQVGIIQPVVCRQDPATGLVYVVAPPSPRTSSSRSPGRSRNGAC